MMKHLAPLLAEERLLMAEEKWIVEALQQIKKQRNCLQIEKLHLQSMKAALRKNKLDMKAASMKTENSKERLKQDIEINALTTDVKPGPEQLEVPDDAEVCNQKVMDLTITNGLSRILSNTFEEEYDDDESEEDNDFFVLGQDQQSADVK